MTEPFFHILTRPQWTAATEQIVAASVATEGFAHCSYAGEVEASANRHFPAGADLVALELDPARIEAEIRVERAPARGTDFPHVYGPIPVGAVVAVWPLTVQGQEFVFSRGSAPAAPDR